MPKPFLTYVQQIQKLKDKNLVIPDEPSAAAILHRCGYFALITGYKDLLKNRTTKRYLDGTTFDDIVTFTISTSSSESLRSGIFFISSATSVLLFLIAFVIYMAKIKAHIWTSTSTIFRLPSKNAKWTS